MSKIKTVNLFEKIFSQPIVVGLGFFDCVHLGHKKLLKKVLEKASELGAKSAVITFSTNPGTKSHSGVQVYDFSERVLCFDNLGLDLVIYSNFDEKLKNLSGREFLETLTQNFNVLETIAGSDFRYGKNAECGIDELKIYLKTKGIETKIVDFFMADGKKLSSSTIGSYIKSGNIKKANSLLSEPYFFLSKIKPQHGRGRQLGFPTANMVLNENRLMPKDGVYATTVEIGGKQYKSVTNIGQKPTFSDDGYAVESYILDFDENLYGKEVKLIFWDRLRDIVKFDSSEKLKEQLKNDIIKRESLA